MHTTIQIRSTRVHNLKNVDVDRPPNKFIVMTGVSGSGKSSLTFDTLYAEGMSARCSLMRGRFDIPHFTPRSLSNNQNLLALRFDSLSDKKVQKILWVLRLVKTLNPVPKQYFKKLESTEDIWEIRVRIGSDTFRLLGCYDGAKLIILTNAFAKKTRKIPRKEIALAERRKKDYLSRRT